MTRFTPSRSYLVLGVAAVVAAAASAWFAFQWAPSWFAVVLFSLTAAALLGLAFRPAIRITDEALQLGNTHIPWIAIRRIEHRGWLTPLVARLTLADDSQIWVIYPGDPDSSQTLLQFLYRFSDNAAIGVASATAAQTMPKYPILRPEDEEEVERLYHRLRSVGHLDPRSNDEE
jgi:Protein of unknown function (DUF3093)